MSDNIFAREHFTCALTLGCLLLHHIFKKKRLKTKDCLYDCLCQRLLLL
uniref:Uncharacterized protein n=1 Tax=Anguilla anguilla TaxID=7936 RepID=A0A0E9T3T6_ANGAN